MLFAERLKFYRQRAGYSQTELADRVGISFSTYNKYETKNVEPKIEILIRLADALGIDVNTLVGYRPGGKENLQNYLARLDLVATPIDEESMDITSKESRFIVSLPVSEIDRIIRQVEEEADDIVSDAREKFVRRQVTRRLWREGRSAFLLVWGSVLISIGFSENWVRYLMDGGETISPPDEPMIDNQSELARMYGVKPGETISMKDTLEMFEKNKSPFADLLFNVVGERIKRVKK